MPVGLKEGLKGLPVQGHLFYKPKQPELLIRENDTEKEPTTIDQVLNMSKVKKMPTNGD